ncbi:MAG: SH3 domain-containing protein, partial [Thermosynechococcaceae cyanobacterium]
MYQNYSKLSLLIFLSGLVVSLNQKAIAVTRPRQVAQVAKSCESGHGPRFFTRVTTNQGDPLSVRSAPAGSKVGSIPNGWAVIVLEWSRNGYWAKVTGRYGAVYGGFASAPDFREGWVSASYLKDLGRLCDKPESAAQLIEPEIFGEQPIEVQGD